LSKFGPGPELDNSGLISLVINVIKRI
jgi:hypothetical protein